MSGGTTGAPAGPRLVQVPDGAGPADVPLLRALLAAAGVPLDRPVVVLVGGAGGTAAPQARRCRELVGGVLVPVAAAAGACVVDGGTDAGVMAVLGRAWHAHGSPGPLVGVAAAGTLALPGPGPRPTDKTRPTDTPRAPAEPHHSHLVVVPGHAWGDEVPWLSAVAGAVAAGRPSVTVLANGGAIAYADVEASLDADRPVLVLAGTGRTADELAGLPAADRPQGVEVVTGAAQFRAALARHVGAG